MPEDIRDLLVIAFTGLLILLRLDAYRFGAAEYDDETASGGWRTGLRRLTWYLLGFALVLVIFLIHPRPISELRLASGPSRETTVLAGVALGTAGTGVAVAFAWFRYRRFRLPAYRHYPGAIANSIGTAFVDEVAFRGVVLGLLLTLGASLELANTFQALLYGLATRLGAPGRSHAMLGMSILLGLTGGWLTYVTGGIGAAFLGHAITRFAIFVCTGHAGQVVPPGQEPEEEAMGRLPPEGWRVVRETKR